MFLVLIETNFDIQNDYLGKMIFEEQEQICRSPRLYSSFTKTTSNWFITDLPSENFVLPKYVFLNIINKLYKQQFYHETGILISS